MTRPVRSPRIARGVVALVVPRPLRDAVLGDLEEEFADRASRSSWRAHLWYWRQIVSRDVLRLGVEAVGLRPGQREWDRKPSRTARVWHVFRTEYTMDGIRQDLRDAIRSIRAAPGLIALAVLSLGVGIGANSAVFSMLEVFMRRPLPYPAAERLVTMWGQNEDRGFTYAISPADFRDYRERSTTADVALWQDWGFNLSDEGDPERIQGRRISSNFFRVVGVGPAHGRAFTLEEEAAGAPRVVIVSDGLWKRRFGADPGVIGRVVFLDGTPHTVVGVLPEGFWWERPGADIWVPFRFTGEESRRAFNGRVAARLNPGVSMDQAAQDARQVGRWIGEQYHRADGPNSAMIRTLEDQLFGNPQYQMGNVILTTAVAFVLLIACSNVANLLLARAAGREREIAVRSALGAGRARLIRQLLAEALVIAAMGGVLGLGVAAVGIRGLTAIVPPEIPRLGEIGLSTSTVIFTAAVALLTGVIFGLAPTLQSTKVDLVDALREGGRTGTGARGGRLRRVLVAGEVAIAVVLLTASALLIQTFLATRNVDLGFDREDVLTFRVTLPRSAYTDSERVNTFHRTLAARLSELPGVGTAAATSSLPLGGFRNASYAVEGDVVEDTPDRLVSAFQYVGPGYFAAIDVPVVAGRAITDQDRDGAPLVVVVNQRFADRHWPDGNAVGRTVELTSGLREIVGVVANTLDRGPDRPPEPRFFLPLDQGDETNVAWVLEVDGAPERLVDPVRTVVAGLDANLPLYDAMSMTALLAEEMEEYRVVPKIISVLGMVALLLAVGGVYGLMSHAVSQRTQEMGIRIALGAGGRGVVGMVVRQGAVLAGMGIVVGVLLGMGVMRGLSVFLLGVNPFDPLTFGGVALALFAAAALATYFPARRASRVDPVEALRAE